MNKSKIIVTLVALAALAGLGVVLWRPATTGLAQLWSPLPTPVRPVEPTAPSEDWPTLTPYPTRGMPTPRGTPVVKASPTPAPMPTRPPVLLTPVPEGAPLADLSSLYYVADTDAGPELRVIGMDTQGRKWTESSRTTDLPLEASPWGPYVSRIYPSPDGTRLAVDVVFGESCSTAIFGVGEGSIHALHEGYEGCHGEWFPDGERILLGRAIINVLTGQSEETVLPDEEGTYIAGISLHPDGTRVAYALVHLPTGSAEMPYTEIWVTSFGENAPELLLKEERVMAVYTLSWSPEGDMLAYVTKPDFGSVIGELGVVDMNGNAQILGRDVPEPGTRYGPVWGPGGQNLAFVRADQPKIFFSDWREPGTNVYVVDLLTVIDQWGTNGSADINGDGIVDVSDVLMLVGNWGACE